MENIGQFFTWIGSAGAFALVMSLILERLPNWENLNSDLKTLLSALVAIGLGLLSAALIKWVPAGVQADLEPWFQRIMAALVIWSGSQYFHWKFDVAPTKTITVTATQFSGNATTAAAASVVVGPPYVNNSLTLNGGAPDKITPLGPNAGASLPAEPKA